ncbi:hypothetical protein BDW22DRAFT_1359445 [Trametopsis cervina]|nr:hypothetical protein BDW22DRAFT_1359445 [Trametopsis cervina]
MSANPHSTGAEDDNPHPRSGNNLIPWLLDELAVPELRQLLDLRKQGWEEKEFDRDFAAQRATAAAPNDKAKLAWFTLMKKAMGELDECARFVPPFGAFSFLDLGCCPCGFTSWILSKNPDARGKGISLPQEQGGHEYTLEQQLTRRFKLEWADLTYYKLHPSADELRGKALSPFPESYQDFDLVILDGHYLRDIYITPQLTPPERWDSHRLTISQIIIALKTVKHGGTLVMKLSHPEWTTTAQTLFLLDGLSTDLRTYKPRVIHGKRGTFYAIAQGVGHGPRAHMKEEYIRQFQALWYEIAFGGENGTGRWFTKEDLDFVVSRDELVEGYLERLAELGLDSWIVQAQALERLFYRKGIAIRPARNVER